MATTSAILGGTFNPFHKGHLHMLNCVAAHPHIGHIIVIPNAIPPHKEVDGDLSPQQRLHMVTLAIDAHQKEWPDCRVEVSDIECRRDGPSWTIDTLRDAATMWGLSPQHYFVVGSDSLFNFHTWREYIDILALTRLLVLRRDTHSEHDVQDYLATHIPSELHHRIECLDNVIVPVSSDQIRESVRAGRSIEAMVPPVISRYIKDEGLYQ